MRIPEIWLITFRLISWFRKKWQEFWKNIRMLWHFENTRLPENNTWSKKSSNTIFNNAHNICHTQKINPTRNYAGYSVSTTFMIFNFIIVRSLIYMDVCPGSEKFVYDIFFKWIQFKLKLNVQSAKKRDNILY